MNILIPMAGRGQRFQQQNITIPKPLIDIYGTPMIELVVDNVRLYDDDHFIFIIQTEHIYKYNLYNILKNKVPNCTIINIDYITEGAASTCMIAKYLIDNEQPLIIANCDQLVKWNKKNFRILQKMYDPDGVILVFNSNHPNNSYVKFHNSGKIHTVIEKVVISNHATCGIYYWQHGSDFVVSATQMMTLNDKTNKEFYVCPTYKYLLQEKNIIPFFTDGHAAIGTPDELNTYLRNTK